MTGTQIVSILLIPVVSDHLVLHIREPLKVASFSPEVVFTDLLPYELRREREGPFKCDDCGRSFPRLSRLRRHCELLLPHKIDQPFTDYTL